MMEEDIGERMSEILYLCETDPDLSLELIEQVIKTNPKLELSPFARFAKAIAYGSKGLFKLLRNKSRMDWSTFNEEELRRCTTYNMSENISITAYPSIDHAISQFCTVRLVALAAGLLCSQIFFWVIGIESIKTQTVRLASGGVSSLGGWHPRLPRRLRFSSGVYIAAASGIIMLTAFFIKSRSRQAPSGKPS
jgi:hypothetical protein